MAFTVLLCTDGSELADAALATGLATLRPADRIVVATVVEPVDPMLVVGTGIAGGVMPPEEAQRIVNEQQAAGEAIVTATRSALDLDGAEIAVVTGSAGSALCDLAESLPASVIVLGTRGHGGFRRAVLGSVSDHVVRHASCPVVTVGQEPATAP